MIFRVRSAFKVKQMSAYGILQSLSISSFVLHLAEREFLLQLEPLKIPYDTVKLMITPL